jgi:hypothetical protein
MNYKPRSTTPMMMQVKRKEYYFGTTKMPIPLSLSLLGVSGTATPFFQYTGKKSFLPAVYTSFPETTMAFAEEYPV